MFFAVKFHSEFSWHSRSSPHDGMHLPELRCLCYPVGSPPQTQSSGDRCSALWSKVSCVLFKKVHVDELKHVIPIATIPNPIDV